MPESRQVSTLDLSIEFCGMRFKNPLVLSSGMLTAHERGMTQGIEHGCGGISAKTVGPRAKKGHPEPRIVRPVPYYIINAQGVPNPGIDAYKAELRRVKERAVAADARFIGSVLGDTPDEMAYVAQGLEEAGCEMIELNISCVHPTTGHKYGFFLGDKPDQVESIVRAMRKAVKVPIIPKLSSHNILDVPILARAAEEAGADAVIVANTFPALLLNPETLRPALGNPDGVGGLSGPAIKPIVWRMVADTARVVRIPIIATGGVMTGQDILELLALGASLVQVHSVVMMEKFAALDRLVNEFRYALANHGFGSAREAFRHSLQYLPAKPLQMLH